MMFAPNALMPRPGRTMRMKPSHMSGRSSIALALDVRFIMAAMLSGGSDEVKPPREGRAVADALDAARERRDGRRMCAWCPALRRRLAAQQPRSAGLLARAGVPVQGAALDRLVDRPYEGAVLGCSGLVVAGGDRRLEAAEEG